MAPAPRAVRGLCVLDLDGTLVATRTIERLAYAYGIEAELAKELRRPGEPASGIDETGRVLALFAGAGWTRFDAVCRAGDVKPDARAFVETLRRAGVECGIATASYLPAARAVAQALGIQRVAAVRPEVEGGRLTGRAHPFEWSGTCGHAVCKERVLEAWRNETGAEWSCAVGDGDNDVCMFRTADLAIAVEPATASAKQAAGHVVASFAAAIDVFRKTRPTWAPDLR